jgi:hypothetical protein
VITGTGRAGTTFLMQLLTELGLDTGFSDGACAKHYYEHCSAGLERPMRIEASPYIVKNPAFCDTLPSLLGTGRFVFDHVLVPIRDLDEAAQSRIRIGGADGRVPGGLLGTSDPAQQKTVLAEAFHRLMHTLAAHDIPHTLLHFPRLALDADYAWGKLGFLVPGAGRQAFDDAFRRVARPELIHRFDGTPAPDQGRAAERFLLSETRRRRRRRATRLAAVVAIAAAAAVAARLYVAHARAGTAAPEIATDTRP